MQPVQGFEELGLRHLQVAELHKAALEEDASIFDYDSHFDTIQQQRTAPKQQEKLVRKSRYIEGLLDKAKEREREQDIVYERRCAPARDSANLLSSNISFADLHVAPAHHTDWHDCVCLGPVRCTRPLQA